MEDKKVIWITGASSGIGKSLAIKFAKKGWQVAASARRENLLIELNKINSNIHAFPLDVTDSKKCNWYFLRSLYFFFVNREQPLNPSRRMSSHRYWPSIPVWGRFRHHFWRFHV